MNGGNSIMDNKNPTGIKEHDTSCVIEQSESTTNKENNVKTSADKPNSNNNKKKYSYLVTVWLRILTDGQFQKI